jgi:hypothetical protein
MISQLQFRASATKTLEDLISHLQLSPALLRLYRLNRTYRRGTRNHSQAAALMLQSPRWPASRESMPPDLNGNLSGDAHVN